MALRPLFFLFFFFSSLLILPLTCNASRYRFPPPPPSQTVRGLDGAEVAKANAGYYDHFMSEIGKLTFNVLPKVTPIPPSGPSRRGNGITDSVVTQRDASP